MKSVTAVIIASAVISSAAFAVDLATGEEIKEAFNEQTLQGSMLSDRFSEFYGHDGTIKADGYSGQWSVTENSMCFKYGSDPTKCWGIAINGPAITLYKDGKVDGAGVLVPGNPNNF